MNQNDVNDNVLAHYGVLGMKWGVRRYQNQDGTLTAAGRARLEKQDNKWARRNNEKLTAKARKKSSKELNRYAAALVRTPGAFNKNGKLSAAAVTAYNQKMAELMTQKVSELRAPSGRVVRFVAKRGEIGVMMALADEGYNMEQLRRGVWGSGRVAYKKTVLNKIEHSALRHHGVKDQKWGVRHGPPYPLDEDRDSTPRFDYGKMNLNSSALKTVLLPKREYAKIMSEVATHISDAQRKQPIFQKAVGNILYTLENGFNGTYRVVDRRRIADDAGTLYERWSDDD